MTNSNEVKEIILKAKKQVHSSFNAEKKAFKKGDGLDFREIREYVHGDDIKKINHKATAKSGELKINVFDEEKKLNIILSYALSSSLFFGSCRLKSSLALEVLALLGFSAMKGLDRLTPIIFGEKIFHEFQSQSRDSELVDDFILKASKVELKKTRFNDENFCQYINDFHKQKSMIFIVGDFFDEVDFSQISYKNEVYLICIRDRLEENLNIFGTYNLTNLFNMQERQISINKSLINKYAKLIEEKDAKLLENCLNHGINFIKIYTDEDAYFRLLCELKA